MVRLWKVGKVHFSVTACTSCMLLNKTSYEVSLVPQWYKSNSVPLLIIFIIVWLLASYNDLKWSDDIITLSIIICRDNSVIELLVWILPACEFIPGDQLEWETNVIDLLVWIQQMIESVFGGNFNGN